MISAAISVYYYFRVIQAMYFKAADSAADNVMATSTLFKTGLIVLAAMIIILGVMPQMLLQYLYF
jgi:NADH-quinone oxidoreductase subunit N